MSNKVEVNSTDHHHVGDHEHEEDVVLVLNPVQAVHVDHAHYYVHENHGDCVLLGPVLALVPGVPKGVHLEKKLQVNQGCDAPVVAHVADEQKQELDAKYNRVCYEVRLLHYFERLHYFEQPDK